MDLKNNKDLKELVDTFAIMNKDGIISTDDEFSTEDEEEVCLAVDKSEITYKIPRINLDNSINKSPVQPIDPNSYFNVYADKYISFTNKNPTTYHVIDYFKSVLENNGFIYFSETETMDQLIKDNIDKDGGLYFTIRSDLSLVAFVLGGKWKPESGIGVIATHVDSLTVKLKPSSIKSNIDGYNLLGVANYSGSLNKLWLDRDLGIGGTILVKEDGKVKRKLVSSSPYPIAKIPSLAEHFGDIANKEYNKETEMVPIIGYGSNEREDNSISDEENNSPLYGKHSIGLLRYISQISEVPIKDIVALDLELFDVQKATRGGLSNEFIFAPRIDDRLCSFSAIYSLIEFSQTFYANPNSDSNPFRNYEGFNLVHLNDNEEIGSGTRTGAKGKFLTSTIQRILSIKQFDDINLVEANSIILSADVTHALNPNFKNVYLEHHYPVPNKGLTIKLDANQHVMTDSIGVILLGKIAKKNGQQLQQFHIRNDSRSGGTIGPILATETGARVIDVGLPQLSMHSIRAMCGFKEVGLGIRMFKAFFKDWRSTYDEIDY